MQRRDYSSEIQVQRWRTGASITWSVLLFIPISLLMMTLSAFNVLNPISSLWDHTMQKLSLFGVMQLFVVALTVALISSFNAKLYTVKPVVLCRRSEMIWNVMKPEHTLHMLLHGAAAGLLAWTCSARFPPDAATDGTRVSERNVFLVLFAVFIGLICAVQFIFGRQNHLVFAARQRKFVLMKSELFSLIRASFKYSFHKMKYFYVAYYLFIGQLLKGVITNLPNVSICESNAMDSMMAVLDVSLMWRVLLAGAFVHLTYTLPRFLYIIYQTEPYEFPLEVAFSEDPCLTLGEALSLREQPLLQYMAFQDASLLAKHSASRRRQVFSLSTLGGHPHNWTAVSHACLTSLADFTHCLASFNSAVMAKNSTDATTPAMSKGNGAITGTPPSPWKPPSTAVSGSVRLRTTDQLDGQRCNPCTGIPGTETMKEMPHMGLLHNVFTQLHNTRAVAFFVAELHDAASCKVFSDAQKQIWAIEALSYLVTASFKEDTYGVVQENLSKIISCLLTLQEAVERHFKLALYICRKPPKGSQVQNNATMRFLLKDTLKSAIYRIVVTFGTHLKCVTLPTEHSRRLQLFMDYKE